MANPMYQKIAEDLRQQIESGELAPGSQLPTELELRERNNNASRNTVRDAIKWLINLGLVETRPGQGTFVIEARDPFVTTLSGDPTTGMGGDEGASYLSEVTQSKRKPLDQPGPGRDPAGLRGRGHQPADRRGRRGHQPSRTALHRRHTLVVADVVLPDGVRGSRRGPPLQRPGISKRAPSSTWPAPCISARSATATGSPCARRTRPRRNSSSCPSDGRVAMFEIFRTAFDGNQAPMRLTKTVFPADRNQFIVNNGQVPPPAADTEPGYQNNVNA